MAEFEQWVKMWDVAKGAGMLGDVWGLALEGEEHISMIGLMDGSVHAFSRAFFYSNKYANACCFNGNPGHLVSGQG